MDDLFDPLRSALFLAPKSFAASAMALHLDQNRGWLLKMIQKRKFRLDNALVQMLECLRAPALQDDPYGGAGWAVVSDGLYTVRVLFTANALQNFAEESDLSLHGLVGAILSFEQFNLLPSSAFDDLFLAVDEFAAIISDVLTKRLTTHQAKH